MPYYGDYNKPQQGYYGSFGTSQRDRDILANRMNYQAVVDEGDAGRTLSREQLGENARQFNEQLAFDQKRWNERDRNRPTPNIYISEEDRSQRQAAHQQRYEDEQDWRKQMWKDELGQRDKDRYLEYNRLKRAREGQVSQQMLTREMAGYERDRFKDELGFRREGLEAEQDRFANDLLLRRDAMEIQKDLGMEQMDIQRYGIDEQSRLMQQELDLKGDYMEAQIGQMDWKQGYLEKELGLKEEALSEQSRQFDEGLDWAKESADEGSYEDRMLDEQARQFDVGMDWQKEVFGERLSMQQDSTAWEQQMKEAQYKLNLAQRGGAKDPYSGRSWYDMFSKDFFPGGMREDIWR